MYILSGGSNSTLSGTRLLSRTVMVMVAAGNWCCGCCNRCELE